MEALKFKLDSFLWTFVCSGAWDKGGSKSTVLGRFLGRFLEPRDGPTLKELYWLRNWNSVRGARLGIERLGLGIGRELGFRRGRRL